MKYNILSKCFSISLVLFLFFVSTKSFADETTTNNIAKIIIEKADNKNYNLNIFFQDKYTGNAFVQKREKGSYYVYFPETSLKAKKIKIKYQNKNDKKIIKISELSEKNFLETGNSENYAKFNVKISPQYSIRLIAKTMPETNPFGKFLMFIILKIMPIIVTILALIGIIKISNNVKFKKPKINLSKLIPNKTIQNKKYSIKIGNNNSTKNSPVTNSINNGDNTFSCFDFIIENNLKSLDVDFKTNLNNTSTTPKNKLSNTKQSKPKQENLYGGSELLIPVVQDLVKVKEKEEEFKNAPKLLSELKITPNKGFYLTTMDNTFSLFGFVGEKIFLLKKFNDLTQINLQARYYDTKADKDLYIVRLDSYKAIIEIAENGIKELAAL